MRLSCDLQMLSSVSNCIPMLRFSSLYMFNDLLQQLSLLQEKDETASLLPELYFSKFQVIDIVCTAMTLALK